MIPPLALGKADKKPVTLPYTPETWGALQCALRDMGKRLADCEREIYMLKHLKEPKRYEGEA